MCKEMNEKLAFLRDKYGCSAGKIVSTGDTCELELADGKRVPLLPWRVERRFVELKKIVDGKTLEDVSTFRFAAFTAGGDVWAMKLADEGRQPVLVHGSSRTHERDCAFSPDGDALYYLSDRGDGTDVWCARRADTNSLWSANMSFVRERLTTNDVCRRALSVSPDGRLLAGCEDGTVTGY